MKIEASALQLSASHEASQSRSLSAESRITFRQMLGGLAEEKTETDLHERVRKLLESLIERIIAALEGRTVREVAALTELGHITKAEVEQMYVDDIPPTQWRLACQMIVRDEDILVEYPSK